MIVTGYQATRARKLTPGEKEANRVLAAARAPVEHGFGHLKTWRILTKLRTDPTRATDLLRALLVLTNLEVNRRQLGLAQDCRSRPARAPQHDAMPPR
ncbi:transposase family protein [Streptomyces noursei]|uniref:transposase family protein n=1 Tax=Streptomyces noursei TaxID=1971 RepID=UPI0023DCA2FC|nr:transposase family protein [Streptomyces noursei]